MSGDSAGASRRSQRASVQAPFCRLAGNSVQSVLHAEALHGNLYDGHTLGPVFKELEALTGVEAKRIHADKRYRGHNHRHKFRVWVSGQVRRVTAAR